MRYKTQCCIVWFVDDEKKTYNPGLIITSPEEDDEISRITCEMQKKSRKVRIFTTHLVDDIRQLPCIDEPIGEGIEGYIHDPWLMW